MNVPPKRLTAEALMQWIEAERDRAFEVRGGNEICRKCGAIAVGQGLAVSIHSFEFGDSCAGPGDVKNLGVPRCPFCERDAPEWISTCVHIPLLRQEDLEGAAS
jgi:hypothetical protein